MKINNEDTTNERTPDGIERGEPNHEIMVIQNNKPSFITDLTFILTEINQVRLYWFWTKYVLLSSIDEQSPYSGSSIHLLNTLSPITNVLSYSLYWTRIVCLIYRDKDKPSPFFQIQVLSDALWSIANLLSCTYLDSPSIRPTPYQNAWWGNIMMGVLLIYDVAILHTQYRAIKHEHDEKSQLDIQHQQKSRMTQLIYACMLIVGFSAFRNFFLAHRVASSFFGSTLCMSSTIITNNLEWFHLKNKHEQLKKREGERNHSSIRAMTYACMTVNTLFPLVLWGALRSTSSVSIVVSSLFFLALINIYTKQSMSPQRSSLVISSFFNRKVFCQSERHEKIPVIPEVQSQDDVTEELEDNEKSLPLNDISYAY